MKKIIAALIKGAKEFELKEKAESAPVYELEIISNKTGKNLDKD